MADFPFWAVFIFLFLGATIRGQATYWLGRGARAGALHKKSGPAWWQQATERIARLDTSAGHRILDRIGLLAIPLAYLTVGLQSVIIVAAGLVKMPWRLFSLAQVPGALAWATIYSTIGFAAWAAIFEALAGQWWPLIALLLVIAVLVALIVKKRRNLTRAKEMADINN